jgi:hypothetical protein
MDCLHNCTRYADALLSKVARSGVGVLHLPNVAVLKGTTKIGFFAGRARIENQFALNLTDGYMVAT